MATNYSESEWPESVHPDPRPLHGVKSRRKDKLHSILVKSRQPDIANPEFFFRIGSLIDASTFRGVQVPKGVLDPKSNLGQVSLQGLKSNSQVSLIAR